MPNCTQAQSEEQMQAFGKEAVAYLSDSSYHVGIEMIRINLYLDLIKTQNISESQKEVLLLDINKNFKFWIADFEREMYSIRSEYLNYVRNGGRLEHYDTQIDSIPNRMGMYSYRVRFILYSGDVQNRVSLRFNAAYVLGHMVMLSPFQENF